MELLKSWDLKSFVVKHWEMPIEVFVKAEPEPSLSPVSLVIKSGQVKLERGDELSPTQPEIIVNPTEPVIEVKSDSKQELAKANPERNISPVGLVQNQVSVIVQARSGS